MPAAGLLILRIVLGAVAEGHGWRLVSGASEVPERLLGAGAMVLGGMVLLGLLTSIASCLLGLGECVAAVGLGYGESQAITLGFISVCVVVGLTGPGSASLDALLFGPREIVLPPSAGASDRR